jgi:hypothetical protein
MQMRAWIKRRTRLPTKSSTAGNALRTSISPQTSLHRAQWSLNQTRMQGSTYRNSTLTSLLDRHSASVPEPATTKMAIVSKMGALGSLL